MSPTLAGGFLTTVPPGKPFLGFLNEILNGLFLFVFLIYLFYLFLFLAVLGLRCCARAFSSCSEQGLLLVAVHGLLIAVASLVAEHGL